MSEKKLTLNIADVDIDNEELPEDAEGILLVIPVKLAKRIIAVHRQLEQEFGAGPSVFNLIQKILEHSLDRLESRPKKPGTLN